MKTFFQNSLWLVLFLAIPAVPASGQGDVDDLRNQIQSLQDRLEQINVRKGGNVTEIGGARARARTTLPLIRIYDLGDLFAVAPPYKAAISSDMSDGPLSLFNESSGGSSRGGGFGGGGGFFAIGPAATTTPVAQAGSKSSILSVQQSMIDAIKKTISPEIWDTNGGTGTITQLGNAFIISTDADSHDQIDALLNLFRKRWGTLRTVSVRTYWLWLSKQEVANLMESEGEPAKDGGEPVFGLVEANKWKELLADANRPEGYRASLTCYNGQTVSAVSGDQSVAITGVDPVLTTDGGEPAAGRVAYQLRTNIIQEGAALQVTPVSNLSGKTVLLDIHSRVSKRIPKEGMQEVAKQQVAREQPLPEDVAKVLDRPRISQQKFSTTLRVPVGKPMLIGGMTFPGSKPETSNLYLFVRVSVHELRNDTEEAPAEPAKPAAPKK